ncbi:hypothetical protein BR93DRAFT_498510 [Coniochaeta sp. PMI_546]|nr:hypothetical protein BR93DRAFT_498510 [Coniochaeta sp. PMI_546]
MWLKDGSYPCYRGCSSEPEDKKLHKRLKGPDGTRSAKLGPREWSLYLCLVSWCYGFGSWCGVDAKKGYCSFLLNLPTPRISFAHASHLSLVAIPFNAFKRRGSLLP